MAELTGELGISVNDAEHILGRLRVNGLQVAIVADLDPEPRYRVLYPKGRVCAAEDCGTIMRRWAHSAAVRGAGGTQRGIRLATRERESAGDAGDRTEVGEVDQGTGSASLSSASRRDVLESQIDGPASQRLTVPWEGEYPA